MVTYSHVILNAGLNKRWGKSLQVNAKAFLIGGFMPDVPVAVIAIASWLFYRITLGAVAPSMMSDFFDNRYFNDPLWIAGHNMLHSPVMLAFYFALLWRFRKNSSGRGHALFWFVAGCALHAAVDITCHVNDGPVLFFPFDWHTRFHSPISYWDPRHYGREFSRLEHLMDLLLLLYVLGPWILSKLRRQPAP